MPTLTRLLLVFASLLLGSLVVMADELPEDTNKITSLTVEEGKRLVAEFKGNALSLDGITTLDTVTAKALAEFEGSALCLDGLTKLDANTATVLAEYKGDYLYLSGLTALDSDTAKALAGFKGQGPGRLTKIDVDTAITRPEINGVGLYLIGLQRASFGAVRALRQNPRIYMPNHWYLLRYEIAALVGTVVFAVMAGVVVWYSRRHRDAALN